MNLALRKVAEVDRAEFIEKPAHILGQLIQLSLTHDQHIVVEGRAGSKVACRDDQNSGDVRAGIVTLEPGAAAVHLVRFSLVDLGTGQFHFVLHSNKRYWSSRKPQRLSGPSFHSLSGRSLSKPSA